VIPERVRAWAQEHLDDEIVSIEPIGGGLTDTISAIHFRTGNPVVLRYVSITRWGEVGRRHVVSEALGCRLMEGSGLPVPRLIASDPTGEGAGDYANMTSWLPGRVRLEPLGRPAIDELARIATVIHATPAPERPRPYAFWVPQDLYVPEWTSRPALWQRAIDIFHGGAPDTPHCIVHRDFHPGNILWDGDRITGVIDWAETSWGPADLDVAHSRTNFAILHDLRSADEFSAAYAHYGGRIDPDPEAHRFWQISDILGFMPDPGPQMAALAHESRGQTPALVRQRLEHLLAITLEA
jgi:hypothetical protein